MVLEGYPAENTGPRPPKRRDAVPSGWRSSIELTMCYGRSVRTTDNLGKTRRSNTENKVRGTEAERHTPGRETWVTKPAG